MPIKFHREAFPFIFAAYAVIILIGIILNLLFPVQSVFHFFVYAGMIYLFTYFILFFRSPKRKLNLSEMHCISPADGKIVVIEEVEETEFFHGKRILLSVFMSPYVPHVNRAPLSGKLIALDYKPGKHMVAFHPKSSILNERNSLLIENDHCTVLMKQIAGAVARRIVCYVNEGQMIQQGEEVGFIKFGSRVDLYLPLEATIQVKLNQKVKAGTSVLARLDQRKKDVLQ